MLFSNQVKLNGSNTVYILNPDIKSYTLSDMGFQKTNAGNYRLVRSLNLDLPTSYQLKITIKRDLKQFKMRILDSTGFRDVNLFNHDHQKEVEQFRYFMNELSIKKVIKSK
ncbi:hypothetical protein WR164_09880 [Philodulcilactobacillus myokoensis]|uniref:Cysteine desulfurase n=1 Tax=Philodulcilactobacillus myokoensis TaxID=2929573 RepID=A0A9W6B2S0_9LACO|nr:hypothetical protein [Philodulcilactobacillus myokoensis]GLB47009.1 hypothetical protein WR164_09880 [Philodulcilactobacillus myokoensis]